jgi:hypothetical protein
MKTLSCLVFFLAGLMLLMQAQADAAMVKFDAPPYVVGQGGQVNVGLIFDYDDQTPGNQPAPNGLLAAGVRIYWDGDIAAVMNASDVHYNPGFNDTLFTMVEVEPNDAGFIAFVNLFVPTPVPVMSTDLGHFTFTAGNTGGTMNLHLDFFYDKEGEETLDDFLDGQGNTLDSEITFGPDTTLTVIPEPLTILALAVGLAGILARKRLASKA